MDLFVTHWIAQENALYNSMRSEFAATGRRESTHFTDVADQYGLGQIALDYIGWGTVFVDFDNDGAQDLFVVNGSTFQRDDDPRSLIPMRMLLFWNKGKEDGFFEVGPVCGEVFSREHVGRGLAVGDYDNDGDVDAFVVVNGGRAMLLRNEGGNNHHWLKVRVRGLLRNRFGLGVRLRVVTGGSTAVREVGAGSSYCSQNAVGEEVFGIGASERVDTLTVSWPSGETQRLVDLAADRTIVVTEERGGAVTVGSGCGP
jgi:hypothetical protein